MEFQELGSSLGCPAALILKREYTVQTIPAFVRRLALAPSILQLATSSANRLPCPALPRSATKVRAL